MTPHPALRSEEELNMYFILIVQYSQGDVQLHLLWTKLQDRAPPPILCV